MEEVGKTLNRNLDLTLINCQLGREVYDHTVCGGNLSIGMHYYGPQPSQKSDYGFCCFMNILTWL